MEPFHEPPESRAMIHLNEMRDLVGHHVIDDGIGREDQTPGERQIAIARAAAPSSGRVAHADPRHLASDRSGQELRTPLQIALRESAQKIAHPSGEERCIAGNTDRLRLNPNRPSPAHLTDMAQSMRMIENRNNGAVDKSNARRQGNEALFDPTAIRFEESQGFAARAAPWQYQLDRVAGRIDAQGKPTRARMRPKAQRNLAAGVAPAGGKRCGS